MVLGVIATSSACDPCSNTIAGIWLDPISFCATGEKIASCSSGPVNQTATCYVYEPTGKFVAVDQEQPPARAPGYTGSWRKCTTEEHSKVFNTEKMCGVDAANPPMDSGAQ
jgi:hypothetical protein